jgi:diaminopimelate decarboxylase
MTTPAPDDDNPAVRRLSAWDAEGLAGLAADYGTPLYVVDLDRVRENCARLREAFPEAKVSYAVKAHTGRAVLETVREAGVDAECASAGEVQRARKAGFPGSRIHYTAVNPPSKDLDYVVETWWEHPDLTVVVGAEDTLDRLADRDYDGRVAIRVNPGVGAGHHEKVTTGNHPKFGVPYDRAADVAERAAAEFDLVGLHAHAGSGISNEGLADHRELVRRMGDLTREAEGNGHDLEFVDVGGGFGVPYSEEEPPLDLEAVADATREALGETGAQLAVEPGRYVVADAGVLLARVNTVKPAGETLVAGIDAGMTDLLRPAMYDAYHEIRNLTSEGAPALGDVENATRDPDPPTGRETVPTTVAGPICETADVFCEERPLPRAARGDVVAIGNAGAYGYEMSSTYNSRPRPAEVALEGDDSRIVRQRERIAALTDLETDR